MRNLFLIAALFLSQVLYAQSPKPEARIDSIGKVLFVIPEFFTCQKEDSLAFLEMRNNDTSVCQMRIFPDHKGELPNDSVAWKMWKALVPAILKDADEAPRQVMPDTLKNGWKASVAIGNYREGGKRGIVFFYVFRKSGDCAIAMVNFSDRIFRQPVNKFDAGLKLKE